MSAAQAAKPKPKPRPRAKRGVDDATALSLRINNGLSYAQIGAIQGKSKQAIHQRLRHILPDEATEAYKAKRADILSRVQLRVLESIDDESINKAPLAARATTYGILYDKERLERGQSTSNMMSVHADLEALRGARREIQEADEIDV